MQELGHFAYRVIRAIQELSDRATGPNIHCKLEKNLGLRLNVGQMYLTLDQLAREECIEAREEAMGPISFKVTLEGERAAKEYLAALRSEAEN